MHSHRHPSIKLPQSPNFTAWATQGFDDSDDDEHPTTAALVWPQRSHSEDYPERIVDCCSSHFSVAGSDLRKGRIRWNTFVVVVGITLWAVSFMLVGVGVFLLKAPPPGDSSGDESAATKESTPPSSRESSQDEEKHDQDQVFPCPCACKLKEGAPILLTPDPLQTPGQPVTPANVQTLTLPPLPNSTWGPQPPTLPPLPPLPPPPPPPPPPPQQPAAIATVTPPPPPPSAEVDDLSGKKALEIGDGMRALVIEDSVPIMASATSAATVGMLHQGDRVTVAGYPEVAGGPVVVPVKPKGFVDIKYLKFQDPMWTCHEWDATDRQHPSYKATSPIANRPVCERDRNDGFEYKFTPGSSRLAAPGCEDRCWCCKRKTLKLESAEAAMERRLDEFQAPSQNPDNTLSFIPLPASPELPIPVQVSFPTPPPPPIPTLAPTSGTCQPGDRCSYGQTWCTKEGYEPVAMERVGVCRQQKCRGPDRMPTFPNSTCGSPTVPKLNITAALAGLPKYVRWALSDIPWLNGLIADALAWRKLHDFTLELDFILTQIAEWTLSNSEVRWLVGCWPPQRYLVSDGAIRFASGRIYIRLGSFDIVISLYNLRIAFRDLRADLECHDDHFYMSGVTQGAAANPLTPERFDVTGEVDVQCRTGFSVVCIFLMVFRNAISQEVIRRGPDILTGWLGNTNQMLLGPGCPEALQNVVAMMTYDSKECCEEQFVEDRWGCLVGGQFNGRHSYPRRKVSGVECEQMETERDQWIARCDTIPGGYKTSAPGICEEMKVLPIGNCSGCNPGWPQVITGLNLLYWANLCLTVALLWTCLACCLFGCSSERISRSRARMEGTLSRLISPTASAGAGGARNRHDRLPSSWGES